METGAADFAEWSCAGNLRVQSLRHWGVRRAPAGQGTCWSPIAGRGMRARVVAEGRHRVGVQGAVATAPELDAGTAVSTFRTAVAAGLCLWTFSRRDGLVSACQSPGSQAALGGRDFPLETIVEACGHAKRTPEGLEHGLGNVVGVVAREVVDVQGHTRVVDKALEELVREVDIKVPDPCPREAHPELETRPPGKIHHDSRERLIERHVGVPVTADPLLVADRLGKRLAEHDADVLHGVVRIDLEIAPGIDGKVQHAVAGHLVEHVLEKRQAGRKPGFPATVQVQADRDLGLAGIAFDTGGSRAHG